MDNFIKKMPYIMLVNCVIGMVLSIHLDVVGGPPPFEKGIFFFSYLDSAIFFFSYLDSAILFGVVGFFIVLWLIVFSSEKANDEQKTT